VAIIGSSSQRNDSSPGGRSQPDFSGSLMACRRRPASILPRKLEFGEAPETKKYQRPAGSASAFKVAEGAYGKSLEAAAHSGDPGNSLTQPPPIAEPETGSHALG